MASTQDNLKFILTAVPKQKCILLAAVVQNTDVFISLNDANKNTAAKWMFELRVNSRIKNIILCAALLEDTEVRE